jgi:acyl-CoA reductase-like NAD-dependent aldehyde dehydrogenase
VGNLTNPKIGGGILQSPETAKNNRISSINEIEQALKILHANKDRWTAVNIGERIKFLDKIRRDMKTVSGSWVSAGVEAKRIPPDTFAVEEEKIFLGSIFGLLSSMRKSLREIEKYGRPRIAGPVAVNSNGQVVAKVFPYTKADRMMFPGVTEEVWMEPGITIKDVLKSQPQSYHDKQFKGAVSLILGAGNLSCLPISDVVYRLFVANRVVVLKLNPVNEYLGPLIEKGFRSLIKQGYFRVVYGGAAEGNYLCDHPLVDEIHLTGSDKTFESIIFGPGAAGAERKAQKKPLITKPVTGELGNITPVIIVPGPWDNDDIARQAEKITIWLAFNAGCNCLTPRVIVQHKNWPQRETLLKAIGGVMSHIDTRYAYYPGAAARHAAFVAAHPGALQFGDANHGCLPWTLIPDVDPKNNRDICFNTESFCSLFAETALEAKSVPAFIARAVDFVNGTLWGTLTASIIIHPQSLLDPDIAAALERALLNLRYGTVCVNEWGASAYALNRTPWGAFPGSNIYDVQSGIGFVNNTVMFQKPQKTVIRGPFKVPPAPAPQ